MISSIASALIALILICIISIGILLEIKYMSQHEVISSTTTDHHNHHKRAPSRSLSKADGLFSDHGGGGSDYSDFIIHENPSRRTVSRRSLSSGSEGSIIQIGISDPHTNDDDNNDPQTSSNKRKTNWLQKFLQFFQRNFYQTNYFLSISTKRLFRILFLLINLMEISFILFYFITNKSIWSTTSTSSGTATSSNNGSNIPSQLERFSAWLSIIYIFWFDYHSASNVYLIMKSMKKFLIILILFFLFIVFCTCIGAYDYHLNNYSTDIHDDDGSGSSGSGGTSSGSDDMPLEDTSHSYFKTFSSSLWTIFTSISTTNFPNQLIPYYTQSRLLFLYFFLYLTIGNILFLNLILIIVIAEYNNSLQQNQQQKLLLRIYNLKLAFHILDVYHRGYLSYNQVYDLLHEVYHSYPEFRGTGYFTHQIPSSNELAVLIAALDINGNNCIYEEQFMWILHLTQIVIQEKVSLSYLRGGRGGGGG